MGRTKSIRARVGRKHESMPLSKPKAIAQPKKRPKKSPKKPEYGALRLQREVENNDLNLLPHLEGPKLGPFQFKGRNSQIKWLERLDNINQYGADEDSDSDDGDNGQQSYVFHAKIDNQDYAIKVFKFYDPMDDELFWGPICHDSMPLTKIGQYLDPFYAECRAYGRLKESMDQEKLKYKSTVACHGYILLEHKDIQGLSKKNKNIDLTIRNHSYQSTTIEKYKPRAIVKDWVATPTSGLDPQRVEKIQRGIVELNNIANIYNTDIHEGNFCDGLLVDFGSSWTMPNEIFDLLGDHLKAGYRVGDRSQFDQIIGEIAWTKAQKDEKTEDDTVKTEPTSDDSDRSAIIDSP